VYVKTCCMQLDGERVEDTFATRRPAVCSWRAGGGCICYEKTCSMQLASGRKMHLLREDLQYAAGERAEDALATIRTAVCSWKAGER
jgi:hypothetical protein